MKKSILRISTALFIAVISVLLGVFVSYHYLNSKLTQSSQSIQNNQDLINKVLRVDDIFKNRYLGKLGESALIDGMISGYVEATGDKYACYIRKAGYKAYIKYIDEGTVSSVGIVADADKDGYLSVKTVLAGSPACKAKIYPGDVITQINGSDVKETGALPSLGKLILSEGTSVDVTWKRDNLSYSATLEYLPSFTASSVTYTVYSAGSDDLKRIEGEGDLSVLYIGIKYFGETTPDEISSIIEENRRDNMQIIIDLRNNRGGTIESLQRSADLFIPAGILFNIDSTLDPEADEDATMPYYSDQSEIEAGVTVIVNEYTAREAEVFALVMKEFEKGEVVGCRTAGIASIQSYIDLGDETAMVITTRTYRMPKGTAFDGTGVAPTVECESSVSFERLTLKEDEALLAALNEAGLKYEEPAPEPEPPEEPVNGEVE